MTLVWLGLLMVGLLAGIMSGLEGIGGGLVIIPLLVYGFGFSQYLAQGTTLAVMIPPIGLLAAYAYWKQGHVDIRAALLIAGGFIAGSWLGAKLALNLPELVLRRVFGLTLLVVAIRMLVGR